MKKIISSSVIAISLVFVVLWQLLFASDVNYYLTSVCILVLSMIPFFASFESKRMDAKEITLIATMIALAVVSRVAFMLVPQVKPIGAVVIVAGACLGAERGYIVGAFSAFVSNFVFGQGMWTPFQMVALGLVGFVAGMVFKRLIANRLTLSLVGFILCFALYGVIVDLSTVLSISGNKPTLDTVLSVYASGVPFSAIFGASTAVFLFIFGEAFIKKLDRVNVKYNLIKK